MAQKWGTCRARRAAETAEQRSEKLGKRRESCSNCEWKTSSSTAKRYLWTRKNGYWNPWGERNEITVDEHQSTHKRLTVETPALPAEKETRLQRMRDRLYIPHFNTKTMSVIWGPSVFKWNAKYKTTMSFSDHYIVSDSGSIFRQSFVSTCPCATVEPL